MPITNADIVAYASANMPEDLNASNIGGAIDTTTKVVFTDIDVTGTVEMLSSAAGDTTQNVTIYYRDATGEVKSESKQLNGTGVVSFTGSVERIMKIVVDAAHTGTITVRKASDAGDLATLESGVLAVRRLFYNIAAAPAGGAERKFYEKIFMKNNHGTLTLVTAEIYEDTDPVSIAFAVESSLDGSDTNGASNNRMVAPDGYTFDSADKSVANGGNHSAGAAQGIWLEYTVPAGTAPGKDAYIIAERGYSIGG